MKIDLTKEELKLIVNILENESFYKLHSCNELDRAGAYNLACLAAKIKQLGELE